MVIKGCFAALFAGLLCTASSVGAVASEKSIPRPEYPNPQMVRNEWLNLNGEWDFAETDDSSRQYLNNETYPDKIVVPFCRESKLSGLGRLGFMKNVWYRRSFEMPKSWKSQRTLLHIGACDWETSVWLNGQLLGSHKGGSAPIIFDITKYLETGKNTIIVHAFDDTRSGLQETGKQSHDEKSNGCVYTRVTGIWQTVWLEGVGQSYIKNFEIECYPHSSRVFLKPDFDISKNGLTVKAVAFAGDRVVGKAEVPVDWRNTRLELKLSEKHLWTIEKPFLYGLKLVLLDGNKVVDELSSYFGLRTVTIKGAAILINNKPVFQRLVLDQGYYPDGIWTASSDEALKRDIELSQAAGFNGARLHQKVFEPRYLYWADKLGYIVWGESPNWGMNAGNPLTHLPFIDEWMEIVKRDINHPAIVGWCPFNETPGDAVPMQNTVTNLTRMIDPSRPVIDTSGWSHGISDPEVMDMHDYDQNPNTFAERWAIPQVTHCSLPIRYGGGGVQTPVPFFISEFGGTGWNQERGWGYGASPKNVEDFYTRISGLAKALLDSRYSFGFCYTQLYDVEQEQNGLYTYEREPKFDMKRMHSILSAPSAYEKNPPTDLTIAPLKWQILIGSIKDRDLAREWHYTFDQPSENWLTPNFDDSAWKLGFGGFGKKSGHEGSIRTPWSTSDIWLRQDFDYNGSTPKELQLVIHHDDDCELYINGKLVYSKSGWVDRYIAADISKAGCEAIKAGHNVMAVHCKQQGGGQFIDLALLAGN